MFSFTGVKKVFQRQTYSEGGKRISSKWMQKKRLRFTGAPLKKGNRAQRSKEKEWISSGGVREGRGGPPLLGHRFEGRAGSLRARGGKKFTEELGTMRMDGKSRRIAEKDVS